MTSNNKRYKHNEVKLTVDKKAGSLQLWLPKKYSEQYFGKKQKAISFGVKDTTENRTEAEQARLQLQKDLQQGVFDPEEIIKYKHPSKQASQGYVPKSQQKKWGLYELWRKFAETKKSVVAETTYAKKYSEGCFYDKYFRELRKQSFGRASDQSEIRNELAEKVEGKTILVMCYQLISSMINWAIDEELLAKDHPNRFGQFRKEQEQFNKRNQLGRQESPAAFQGVGENNREKIAFTWEEAQAIIEAFHNRHNRYPGVDYLAYMVEFLFLTGMRHGEARGLNWSDVSKDGRRLTIARSYSEVGMNGKHTMKATKNGKVRELPLNQRAQEILREIRPNCPNANDPIFVDVKGRRLKISSMYIVWAGKRGIKSPIMPLVEEGKVSQYLKPYATRKTFITRQLQNGVDPKTVAYWVGDNVDTIMEYYSDINREAVPV
jgi:integrase